MYLIFTDIECKYIENVFIDLITKICLKIIPCETFDINLKENNTIKFTVNMVANSINNAYRIVPMDLIHKSQNAPVPYPTMLRSELRNVHISILNRALWDMEQVHYGIYEIGLLPG